MSRSNNNSSNNNNKRNMAAAAAEADNMAHDGFCFICTESAKIFALGECNHRMCHVCALRLRALYKNKQCAYCKTDLEWIILTEDASRDYASFDTNQVFCVDNGLGIKYQYRETFLEVSSLLKHRCPKCDFITTNWYKLKAHVREEHQLVFCDMCIQHKKVFSHEQPLFTHSDLHKHRRGTLEDKTTGFRGHPECSFCNKSFYDHDQLFEHCRSQHEQCHLCVRSGVGRDVYYKNYASLEEHFKQEHFLCLFKECLDSKFVVFSTEIDLKVHEYEVHGVASTGQRSLQRRARQIEIDIVYASNIPSRMQQRPEPRIRDASRADRREASSSRTYNSDSEVASVHRLNVPSGFGRLTSTETPSTETEQASSSTSATTAANATATAATISIPDVQPPKMDPATRKLVAPIIERFQPKFKDQAVKFVQLQVLLRDMFTQLISGAEFVRCLDKIVPKEPQGLLGKIVKAVIDQIPNEKSRLDLLSAWNDRVAEEKQHPNLQPSDFYTGSTVRKGKAPEKAWQTPVPMLFEEDWPDPGQASSSSSAVASTSHSMASRIARTPPASMTKTTTRTASDVVRAFTKTINTQPSTSSTTEDFPSLPSKPKPSRPVVGKPVASSWGPSRQNSQGNSSEGGSTPPTSSRKKGKKGKTLLLYYG